MNKKIKKLLIKTKREVFTEMVGNNASMFLGEGYDFSELREYQIGDDIRKIDWIITAKLHKPYVKLFHAERELNIVAVPLLNGASYFGSKVPKQDIIAECAAILGYSAIKNSDLFSLFGFNESEIFFNRASKNNFIVQKSVSDILSYDPIGKKCDYQALVKNLLKKVKRKSIVFIMGDFFSEVDFKMIAKRHEVVVLIIRDRFEENPAPLGYVNLIDPESQKSLEGEITKNKIEQYKKEVKLLDLKNIKHFKENRIKFVKIYTDENPFVKLLSLFRGGR